MNFHALQKLYTFESGDGRWFIFDPESMLFFQSERELVNWIREQQGSKEEPMGVPQRWYTLEQKIVQERKRVLKRFEMASSGIHVLNRLTILTTTACNLNCSYCYASGGGLEGR